MEQIQYIPWLGSWSVFRFFLHTPFYRFLRAARPQDRKYGFICYLIRFRWEYLTPHGLNNTRLSIPSCVSRFQPVRRVPRLPAIQQLGCWRKGSFSSWLGYRKNKPPFPEGVNVLKAGSVVTHCDYRKIIASRFSLAQKKSIVLLHFGTSGERCPGVKVSTVMKWIERSEHGISLVRKDRGFAQAL